jgi:CDP-diglyceride synthetase
MKRILTAVVVLPFLIASILISSLWWVFVLLAAAAMCTMSTAISIRGCPATSAP